jgi:hypothetical protein
MRILFFAAAVLSATSSATAQDVICPHFYPEKDATLTEVPAGHSGSGLLRGSNLSSAFMYVGELHSDPTMNQPMQEVPTKAKDGWDMRYNFTPKDTQRWLVCVYGGDRESADRPLAHGKTEWWEKVDHSVGSCTLRFREIKRPFHAPSNWTATATCK